MTNTLEQIPQTPKTREDFLDEKDRGFKPPVDEEREKERAREIARDAFNLIADKLEAENNID
jgi:hypothetical protein